MKFLRHVIFVVTSLSISISAASGSTINDRDGSPVVDVTIDRDRDLEAGAAESSGTLEQAKEIMSHRGRLGSCLASGGRCLKRPWVAACALIGTLVLAGGSIAAGVLFADLSGSSSGLSSTGILSNNTWHDTRPSGHLAPFAWVGVMATGQSLSVGGGSQEFHPGTVNTSYENLALFDTSGAYDTTNPDARTLSWVALKEPLRPRPARGEKGEGGYPRNIFGTTPQTSMAEQISELARLDGGNFTTAHSVVGQSGQGIDYLTSRTSWTSEYTQPYPASLYEAKAFKQLARKAAKTFGYGAVLLTHGEHDASNEHYEEGLLKLHGQYLQDLKNITGQSQNIPMILSQQNSGPFYMRDDNGVVPAGFAYSAQHQWLAARHNPGKIILSGPKYYYSYVDGIHMDTLSYVRLGEKYGQAFYQTIAKGKPWVPLQPRNLTWVEGSNTIVVDFDIPKPPLQWDSTMTTHQTNRLEWKNGRGFEVLDAASEPLSIRTVELVSNATRVRITLSDAPLYGPLTVQYAMTQDGQEINRGYAGTSLGRRGQLRDSDPFVGFASKTEQPNYCVAFSLKTDGEG